MPLGVRGVPVPGVNHHHDPHALQVAGVARGDPDVGHPGIQRDEGPVRLGRVAPGELLLPLLVQRPQRAGVLPPVPLQDPNDPPLRLLAVPARRRGGRLGADLLLREDVRAGGDLGGGAEVRVGLAPVAEGLGHLRGGEDLDDDDIAVHGAVKVLAAADAYLLPPVQAVARHSPGETGVHKHAQRPLEESLLLDAIHQVDLLQMRGVETGVYHLRNLAAPVHVDLVVHVVVPRGHVFSHGCELLPGGGEVVADAVHVLEDGHGTEALLHGQLLAPAVVGDEQHLPLST
mmetsp:Transcript_31924/g.82719  ORF Transcript_31924/g.82719 Transcript_31924/m.82719 type:complete len:288 (-) Transcript_31924:493-1356(-)